VVPDSHHGGVQHPGVLAAASLRTVPDQRVLFQRHAGELALGHIEGPRPGHGCQRPSEFRGTVAGAVLVNEQPPPAAVVQQVVGLGVGVDETTYERSRDRIVGVLEPCAWARSHSRVPVGSTGWYRTTDSVQFVVAR
jgi:hypothetical protein